MKDISLFLHEQDKITRNQIIDLFHKVDEETQKFKEKTGILCPERCGICCSTARVETTAVEMLPLAVDAWSRDEGNLWLDKIEKAEDSGRCVFFKMDSNTTENGRCMVYSFRPLICRLFGFFTVKDKYGNYVYSGCRIIKARYPETYKKVANLIAEGFHLSCITDYTIRIISMGTDLSRKVIPINTAAKITFEKIGAEIDKADRYKNNR